MSTRKKTGELDRADDLLSELQAEVAAAATAEASQLEAARRARIEAEAHALAREAAIRRAEVEARLMAEAERQALRAAALAPTPAPRAPIAEPVVPVAHRPVPLSHAPFAVEPPPPRLGFYGIAIALPLLCVSAVVGALIYQQHRDRPQPIYLHAPVAAPLPARPAFVPAVELTPEMKVEVPEVVPASHAPKPIERPRPAKRPRPTKPKPKPKPKPFDLNIDWENDR